MKRLASACLIITTALLLGAGCSKNVAMVHTATVPRTAKKAPPAPPPNVPLPTPVQPQQ